MFRTRASGARSGRVTVSRSTQPQPGPSTTQKETKKRRKKLKDELEIPSEEAWARMKSFGSFAVSGTDLEDESYKFSKGDTVAILPMTKQPGDEIELWQYWVGTIRDIRAEIYEMEDTNDVWAKVQWYFSGSDVAGVVKSFDPELIPSYERIVADDCDLVCPAAFNDIVYVAQFSETDPFQPFIPRHTFYTRYTLEKKTRVVKPKPGSVGCICQKPYNPDDDVIGSLMHFCPRPSCRRAYHHDCLTQSRSKEPKSLNTSAQASTPRIIIPLRKTRSAAAVLETNQAESSTSRKSPIAVGSPPDPYHGSREQTRALRLLASSPESDDMFSLSSLIPRVITSKRPTTTTVSVVIQRPTKKLRTSLQTSASMRISTRNSGKTSDSRQKPNRNGAVKRTLNSPPPSRSNDAATPTLDRLLDNLPPDLVKIAQQPMVRGGAWWAGGVSGNVKAVSEARLLVYRHLRGEPVNDDWRVQLLGGGSDGSALQLSNVIVRVEGGQASLPAFVCPQCHSAI